MVSGQLIRPMVRQPYGKWSDAQTVMRKMVRWSGGQTDGHLVIQSDASGGQKGRCSLLIRL